MSSEIHVGDIGTQFIITVKEDDSIVDISSASSIIIYLKKPNGVSYEKYGSFVTDGTDGKLFYTSVYGDFDAPGLYKLQAKLTMGGSTYHSNLETFKVYCNI